MEGSGSRITGGWTAFTDKLLKNRDRFLTGVDLDGGLDLASPELGETVVTSGLSLRLKSAAKRRMLEGVVEESNTWAGREVWGR